MTSLERMSAALSGCKTDRVPLFPCIYVGHACIVSSPSFEEGLADPRLGVCAMVEAGIFYGCDAVRVRATLERSWFEEKEVRSHEGKLVQVDRRTGQIDGYFGVQGGGQLMLLNPPPAVRTIEQIEAITYPRADELLDTGCLDKAREMVGDQLCLIDGVSCLSLLRERPSQSMPRPWNASAPTAPKSGLFSVAAAAME
jgi:hypothetical protein